MLIFIDGNDLRAAELVQMGFALKVEALQTGFSTSAPEPGQRAQGLIPLGDAPTPKRRACA